jgi:hypothetical protein
MKTNKQIRELWVKENIKKENNDEPTPTPWEFLKSLKFNLKIVEENFNSKSVDPTLIVTCSDGSQLKIGNPREECFSGYIQLKGDKMRYKAVYKGKRASSMAIEEARGLLKSDNWYPSVFSRTEDLDKNGNPVYFGTGLVNHNGSHKPWTVMVQGKEKEVRNLTDNDIIALKQVQWLTCGGNLLRYTFLEGDSVEIFMEGRRHGIPYCPFESFKPYKVLEYITQEPNWSPFSKKDSIHDLTIKETGEKVSLSVVSKESDHGIWSFLEKWGMTGQKIFWSEGKKYFIHEADYKRIRENLSVVSE